MTPSAFLLRMSRICDNPDTSVVKRLGPMLAIQALLEADAAYAAGVTVLDERLTPVSPDRHGADAAEPPATPSRT